MVNAYLLPAFFNFFLFLLFFSTFSAERSASDFLSLFLFRVVSTGWEWVVVFGGGQVVALYFTFSGFVSPSGRIRVGSHLTSFLAMCRPVVLFSCPRSKPPSPPPKTLFLFSSTSRLPFSPPPFCFVTSRVRSAALCLKGGSPFSALFVVQATEAPYAQDGLPPFSAFFL